MTHDQLVTIASNLLMAAPEYLADALAGAPVGNSVVGSLLSLPPYRVPRQYAEPAVLDAARRLQRKQRHQS